MLALYQMSPKAEGGDQMNEPRIPGYQEPYPMGGSDPDPLPRQVIMTDGKKLIEWVSNIIQEAINEREAEGNRYCGLGDGFAKQILAGLDVYVKVTKPGITTWEEYVPLSEIIKEVE